LAKYYEQGKNIDLRQFVSKEEFEMIIKAAKKLDVQKGAALKPLFEELNSQYEYYKLRLAVAIWEKDKKY
jgi:ATP-dependent DNA helicase RecQ